MRIASSLILVALLLVTSGCGGSNVDLTKGLKIDVVQTGWYDMGIIDGKNKLVPSITFKVTNISSEKLVTLQVNALFRQVTNKDEWGAEFITAAGTQGLAPGATTDALFIKSPRGYTGTDSRVVMMKSQYFIDAKVDLFAKYGSGQWAKIGEFPIVRQLLAK